MDFGTQAEVVDFLQKETPDASDEGLRLIQTHLSVVVLKGNRAWKLKRKVKLPYADFSRPEQRLQACQQEVILNRRTAPTLYLAARRITRGPEGRLAFDQAGELVDAVVEMRRFDDSTLFSTLAASGRLDRPLLTALARHIAGFHAQAEVRPGSGSANILAVLALNEQCTQLPAMLGDAPVRELRAALRAGISQHRALLEQRSQAGMIRACHGDLHLRNLCLVDGEPTLFDCIEFNDSLSTIDVLYDLAFLLMDLWHTGLQAEANWVMNRYMDESGDTDGLPLLPYFMALRASIRAQVLATQASMQPSSQRIAVQAQAQSYLTLASELLQPAPAQLLAVGGLSGSGKSTVAAAIAHRLGPAPGARVLASDRLRKKLAGVNAETRLPPQSYTQASSQAVYTQLYEQAHHTLALGYAVVADAVFSREDERQAIAQCAERANVTFRGFWLETDASVQMSRVETRRHDPSDATPAVVQHQLSHYERPGDWHILPAGDPAAGVAASLLGLLSGPPDWSQAPEGWDWLAQDADGRWFWYAVQPQPGLAGGIWRSPRRAQQFAMQGLPASDWHASCQHRPRPS